VTPVGAAGAAAPETVSGPTRAELVAELAAVVGAPHEARFIVDEALGLGLTLGHPAPPAGPLGDAVVSAAREMASRRVGGEPLQYVFGHWPFRRLDLSVDARVLIPRPETEHVVEVALGEAQRLAATTGGRSAGLVIADAGTGSGAIALSLATELGPRVVAEVWATDASTDALAVAASNLEALRLSQPAATSLPPTTLVHGDWLEPLPARLRGAVGLVVSNPPYVSEAEWVGLAHEVRLEPRGALVAGAASDGTPGLADVEAVLRQAMAWLRRPGAVVIEIAPHQAEAATALASGLGYEEIQVEQDLSRRPRALVARRRD
jgi:release factor glutamine methyltransferase